ncbi:hypothetical protein Pmani_017477 [Petrolisthes manimaculis]|uniref:Uncharacterized protein n=1 Tax=Petrolisthes manimaculis TaxID=1843537 RepID=A0AAE1PMJ4_9EUCA|nr:hypothetical protein Pmani_017477 [Petrolisthes manimaculis]
MCLHGDQRHLGKRKTYTRCEFELDLCIKPVTKITVERDKYRAQYPCFIVIKGTHNHSLESTMGLPPETREEFLILKNFEMGEYDRRDTDNPHTARICSLHLEPDAYELDLKYELLNLEMPSSLIRIKSDALPKVNLATSGGFSGKAMCMKIGTLCA